MIFSVCSLSAFRINAEDVEDMRSFVVPHREAVETFAGLARSPGELRDNSAHRLSPCAFLSSCIFLFSHIKVFSPSTPHSTSSCPDHYGPVCGSLPL